MAPLRMATARSQATWESVSPNSFWIGTLSTPNISQTANIRVNETVDSTRTRIAPGASCGLPAVCSGVVMDAPGPRVGTGKTPFATLGGGFVWH